MRKALPRVRTNVLAVRIEKMRRDDSEIQARLGYWELLELSRLQPQRFPRVREQYLTELQRAEKDAFIQDAAVTPFSLQLWTQNSDMRFQPMPITEERPFYETLSPSQPRIREEKPIEENDFGPAPAPELSSVGRELSRDQALQLPLDSCLFVSAPPGSGKTHFLLDRLEALIQRGEVRYPAHEVLVLSFTRATVSEILARIEERIARGAPPNLRYVQVRTFDSLATAWLLEDSEPTDLPKGYKARIRFFVATLRGELPPNLKEQLRLVRYLVVDEVQDLAGVRGEMVLELANHVLGQGGGLLALGDPAQAIYDFDNDGGLTGVEFIQRLIALLGTRLKTASFPTYYRYRNPQLKDMVGMLRGCFGEDGLGAPTVDLVRWWTQRTPSRTLDWLQDAAETRPIAVLAHNNLEVAQLYRWARDHQIPVQLKNVANQWPGWLARWVGELDVAKASIGQLRQIWKQRVAERTEITFDEAVDFLKKEGILGRGDVLELEDVRAAVQERSQRRLRPQRGLLITTIHQAKGLEYDTVAVLESGDPNVAGDPSALRRIYVAATRAREEVVRLERDRRVFPRDGRKAPFNHFHRYRSGINEFLLEGIEDTYSLFKLADCPATISPASWERHLKMAQEGWWDCYAGMTGTVEMRWGKRAESTLTVPQLLPADELREDLGQLVRGFGIFPEGIIRAPVLDLVTVAVPPDCHTGGRAGVMLVPWTFGWAQVVDRGDGQYGQ